MLGSTIAQADVRFNGFGQVVVGSSLDNNRPMPERTILGDYGADPDFLSESLFGLQAQASLYNHLSATAQIVADGKPTAYLDASDPSYTCMIVDSKCSYTHDDFVPKFDWAYASWAPNDWLTVKAGRQRLPLYHYSDYLQVGEAYPWIRPPLSVYESPISNYDGISFNGAFSLGNWYLQPQVFYGEFDGNVLNQNVTAPAQFHHATGVVFDASYSDWLELRAAYTFGYLSANYAQLQGLQAELSTTPPDGAAFIDTQLALGGATQAAQALAAQVLPGVTPALEASTQAGGAGLSATQVNDYAKSLRQADYAGASTANEEASNQATLQHQFISYSSAGIEINKYNFIFDSEYIFQKSPEFVASSIAYYTSLGYHFGKFTPMVTYGRALGRTGDTAYGNRILKYAKQAYAGDASGAYDAICTAIAQSSLLDSSPGVGSTCSSLSGNELPNNLPGLSATDIVVNGTTESAATALYNGTTHLAHSANTIDDYYEFGIRYDITRNTAFKVDYTYYASPQAWIMDPGPSPDQGDQHAQLLSAAFTFTF